MSESGSTGKTMGKALRGTRSLCPVCDAVLDAYLLEREGRVVMLKECSEHGAFELPYAPDAEFYRRCAADTAHVPRDIRECDATECLECLRHRDRVKTIMIDATERCNLNCPACFTNTHSRTKRDPSVAEIIERLKEWRTRPAVLLCGGEPTLREDLPELIHAISSLGFVVKMASNGIRLNDPGYIRALREAGLGWVLLQFDGFSDDIYLKTRGREMVALKEEVINALGAAGVKVCLAFMAVKGLNDNQLGRLIDYYMSNDHIMHLGCTVLASVGRDVFEERYATSGLDVLRAIERESRGRVSIADFMHTRKIGSLLYRLTGNLGFQQKTCFHMVLLHRRGKDYIPVNRYLTPGGMLRNPRELAELAALYGSLRDWDAIPLTGKVKLLTVEDFRAHDTIDLSDANRCNKVYMTERGYIPPCIYNTKCRAHSWLPTDA